MIELGLKPCWPHSNAGSFYSTVMPANPPTIHVVVKHNNFLVAWDVHLVQEKATFFYFEIPFFLCHSSFFRAKGSNLLLYVLFFASFTCERHIHIFTIFKCLICSWRIIEGGTGLNIIHHLYLDINSEKQYKLLKLPWQIN